MKIFLCDIQLFGKFIGFNFFSSALISTLDSGSEQLIEGTFSTLQKICEDIPDQLESDSIQQPLILLIPKFIEFFKCSSSKIRSHSITCINQFILCRSSALLQNMGLFLEGLFFLSEDKVTHFRHSLLPYAVKYLLCCLTIFRIL